MKLTAIVAVALNGVIGHQGTLPWNLPEDLRRFKARTMGRPVLMGRTTFESIGRPLPGRLNVVLSRGGFTRDGVLVASSFDDALALPEVAEAPEVMVIGGAKVYEEALHRCDTIERTLVWSTPPGDSFFLFEKSAWKLQSSEEYQADNKNPYPMSFETWVRQ